MLGWSIHSLSGQLLWWSWWGLRLRMRSVMWWWSLRQRHQHPAVPSWIKEHEYAKAVSFSAFSTAEVGGWDLTAQWNFILMSSGLVFLPRARNVRNHRCWRFWYYLARSPMAWREWSRFHLSCASPWRSDWLSVARASLEAGVEQCLETQDDKKTNKTDWCIDKITRRAGKVNSEAVLNYMLVHSFPRSFFVEASQRFSTENRNAKENETKSSQN